MPIPLKQGDGAYPVYLVDANGNPLPGSGGVASAITAPLVGGRVDVNIGSSTTLPVTGTMTLSGTITAQQQSRAAAAANIHAPASNTAAVVTYAAAGAGVSNVVSGIAWSYSAAPTGGNLKIEDGSGTTVFSIDITAAGPGFIQFNTPLKGTANTALIVTLAAGGVAVSGKVSVLGKWTE